MNSLAQRQGKPALPRALVRSIGWIIAALLIGAALWYLRGQWPEIKRVARTVHPEWPLVIAAAALVLLTYAQLIEGWRRVLAAMGGHLAPARAAVIWLGSNLARYIPLSGWQMALMTVMAKREAVPVSVSAGASVMLTIVNILTGLGVFFVASAATPTLQLGQAGKVWVIAAAALGLAISPFILPRLGTLASRLTGRDIVMPTIGLKSAIIAIVSTTTAWIMYGVAFSLLIRGVMPGGARSLSGCIALYTGSYLAGVIAIVPPAGLGAAEYAMTALAPELGMFTAAEASVLALIVRVGRTILEIVPGVVALAIAGAVDGRQPRSAD